MALIITDMDMPKCCKDCIFWNYYEGHCRIIIPSKWKDFDIDEEYEKRAYGCPLKSADEIPVLLDKAHEDGFKQGYLQAESDYKVQIDDMIAEIADVYVGYRHAYEVKHDIMQIIHKYCDKE